MKPRSRRGSTLVLVLVIIFALLTLILGLFWTQSLSSAEARRAESDLLAFQATEFEIFRRIQGVDVKPSWLDSNLTSDSSDQRLQGWSAQLFQKDSQGNWKLPYLRTPSSALSPFGAQQKVYPGHQYWMLRRGSSQRQRSWTVTSQSFAYAAWAGQQVNLESVAPWQNPRFGETSQPLQAYSGVPPRVGAVGSVQVAHMPYGFAWSSDSSPAPRVNFSSSAGPASGAVARVSPPGGFPMLDQGDWRQSLRSSIDAVMESASLQAADRTPSLSASLSLSQTLGLFFSQYLMPAQLANPSLREAVAFPMPSMPGLSNLMDFFVIVSIHTPFQPEGSLDSSWEGPLVSICSTIVDALTRAAELAEQIDSLKNEIAKLGKWNPLYWTLMATLEAVEVSYETALDLVELAISTIMTPFDLLMMAAGEIAVPQTRDQENDYVNRGVLSQAGCGDWAYREVYKSFVSIAMDLVSLQFSKVGQELSADLCLVFFGQSKKVQSWSWKDSGFSARATLNVGRGRTFAYQGPLNIQGDLWLGRGATMVVHGNLNLSAGDKPSSGRLYLEEGAVLVVQGNLYCQGDLNSGSVVLGSPVGDVHPTTAAILCSGDVVLPYGIDSGICLDELPGAAGQNPDPHRSPSKMAVNFMTPVLQGAAANLAKVAGPFHDRLPYISSFCSSWGAALEDPIPFVTPMEWSNAIVPAFRGLTYILSPSLNLSLGENFLTHSDWWGEGGEGRVPLLSKSDAYALAEALGNSCSDAFALADSDVTSWLKGRLDETTLAKYQALSNNLCLALGNNLIKILPDFKELPVADFTYALFRDVVSNYNLDDIAQDLHNLVPAAPQGQLQTQMTALWKLVDANPGGSDPNRLTQECAGVLVYSGGTMRIGQIASGGNWSDSGAPLASGFFVSESDLFLRTATTVGAAVSLKGSVTGRSLLYSGDFSRASILVASSESSDWRTRAANQVYTGGASPTAWMVSAWKEHLLTRSWEEWGR